VLDARLQGRACAGSIYRGAGRRRARARHRGSFVLEAFGEELAVDRGQMRYVDPRCATIRHARFHNLAIPHDDDKPMRQHNPCPVASIAEGEGDETRLNCRMNLDGVWPEPVIRCSRELVGNTPQELLVIDRITSASPIKVGFYLQSRFPWRQTAQGWITEGERARLTVIAAWESVSETGEKDFILGTKKPAYCLKLISPPAVSQNLSTRLVVAPV